MSTLLDIAFVSLRQTRSYVAISRAISPTESSNFPSGKTRVYIAHSFRLVGVVDPTGERNFLGAAHADDAPQRIHDGGQGQHDFTLPKLRALGRIPDIAHLREIETAGDGRSAYRADDRLRAKQNGPVCPVEQVNIGFVGNFFQVDGFR